jgi:peroxiredoxin
VAVSFIGMFLAFATTGMFNSLPSRLAYLVALVAHGAAIGIASGRPLLAPIPILALCLPFGTEGLVRRRGYGFDSFFLTGIAAACLAFALQWPVGRWGWALAPTALLSLLLVIGALKGRKALAANQKAAWRIAIGQSVPDFEAPMRLGGAPFRLSAERGRHVLVCFLRGDWCPICQIQMRVYQRDAADLARHNVKLVAVSPSEGPEAEKLARALGVDYTLLVDPRNEIAAIFGAVQPDANKGESAPLPVSFLIDPEGRLQVASKPDDLASFLAPQTIVPYLERTSAAPPPPS